MFTGIVEETGIIAGIMKAHSGAVIKVRVRNSAADIKVGDSVAINGVCLSVTDIRRDIISFDVIQETIRRTTLGDLQINDFVNVETSLRADSRIGGHFVTGHIDYRGKIVEIIKGRQGAGFKISLPDEYSKFVVKKGPVAVDGVSLTVADVSRGDFTPLEGMGFTVYLIPHTLKVTTLGKKRKNDAVNIETDLLAKYIVKGADKPDLTTLLKKYNYI